MRIFIASLLFTLASPPALSAQTSVPPHQATNLKDTSGLKPPAGSSVAVIEYEDLECPYCAHAFPLVHAAVKRYRIPIEEYDFQIPGHAWSHEAAIFAHYLQAKASTEIALEFRREVFATQSRIASKDDLLHFEESFMKEHGRPMPSPIDPTGQFDREVNESTAQGLKLGIVETPTIFVVTPSHWIQVKDVDSMDEAIQQAEAPSAHAAPAAEGAAPPHH